MNIDNLIDQLIETKVSVKRKSGFDRDMLNSCNDSLNEIGLEVDINGSVVNTWDKPGEDPTFDIQESQATGN